MKFSLERRMSPRQWRLFLEEVKSTSIGRELDISKMSDLNELSGWVQCSAALSESRARREVEELLKAFENRLERAA
jgi:hypothetical protein